MHGNTSPLQSRADGPAVELTDSERIAALERQVAELIATVPALQMAFAAGRACERRAAAPRPRPRHLKVMRGGRL